MKNILYITVIYIGTLIGAGFATGKEIQSFFTGPLGIFVALFLFSVINMRLFTDVHKNNIYTYEELLEYKCSKIKGIIKWLSMIFALLSYGIMCNGVEEVISIKGSGVIFSVICCFIFLFELKGITVLNLLATPLIITGIIIIFGVKVTTFADESFNAIKYCSYNTLCCLPIIPSLNNYIKNTKSAVVSAITVSVVAILLIFAVHFSIPEYICNLPMLETAQRVGVKWIYYPALLLAMLTTAVSGGYSFMCCFKGHKIRKLLILFLTSLIMLKIDFGILIEYVFGAFGIAGIVILYFLLKKS